MPDFLVKRDELARTRVAESEPPALEPGRALLRVDSFGITANNVTYAVFGDAMSYWKFFPVGAASEGWGRVPMWGFAEVVDGEGTGARVYGYLPPSSHLVVTPARVSEQGFVDASPHRQELPSAYNDYRFSAADPFYDAQTEALQMLLRPLFYTSFLIDDQLDDDGLIARGPVVLSSASSKTAIGSAFLLSRRGDVELIGLTSERSRAFVDGLGIYSRTVLYDEIGTLADAGGAATFVDIAGDGGVRRAVHEAYGDGLLASIAVGATHRDEMGSGGGGDLPGPAPALFFAPDRVAKRSKDWGGAGLTERAAAAWHPFCEWADGWLEVLEGEGFESVGSAWGEVLDGRVPPHRAHVLKGLDTGIT
jgi:hypothetical protein